MAPDVGSGKRKAVQDRSGKPVLRRVLAVERRSIYSLSVIVEVSSVSRFRALSLHPNFSLVTSSRRSSSSAGGPWSAAPCLLPPPFDEWKPTGSLLRIYGKRMSSQFFTKWPLIAVHIAAGSGKIVLWFVIRTWSRRRVSRIRMPLAPACALLDRYHCDRSCYS